MLFFCCFLFLAIAVCFLFTIYFLQGIEISIEPQDLSLHTNIIPNSLLDPRQQTTKHAKRALRKVPRARSTRRIKQPHVKLRRKSPLTVNDTPLINQTYVTNTRGTEYQSCKHHSPTTNLTGTDTLSGIYVPVRADADCDYVRDVNRSGRYCWLRAKA